MSGLTLRFLRPDGAVAGSCLLRCGSEHWLAPLPRLGPASVRSAGGLVLPGREVGGGAAVRVVAAVGGRGVLVGLGEAAGDPDAAGVGVRVEAVAVVPRPRVVEVDLT